MDSTGLSTAVERITSESLHLYRSCVECLTEYPRDSAPERCPDCGGRLIAGRLANAFTAVQLAGGL